MIKYVWLLHCNTTSINIWLSFYVFISSQFTFSDCVRCISNQIIFQSKSKWYIFIIWHVQTCHQQPETCAFVKSIFLCMKLQHRANCKWLNKPIILYTMIWSSNNNNNNKTCNVMYISSSLYLPSHWLYILFNILEENSRFGYWTFSINEVFLFCARITFIFSVHRRYKSFFFFFEVC